MRAPRDRRTRVQRESGVVLTSELIEHVCQGWGLGRQHATWLVTRTWHALHGGDPLPGWLEDEAADELWSEVKAELESED